MKNRMVLAAVSILVLLSACKTMQTADKKMQAVDKKMSAADAKLRKKMGLKPYQKDDEPAASDAN